MDYRGETDKFRDLLNQEHSWPTTYIFKFIVKGDQEREVTDLFDEDVVINKKPSSAGKYTSVTIQAKMATADEVIAIYNAAASIEGIISL